MPKVLLVDDSKFSRGRLRAALTGLAADISEATNGLEALEQLAIFTPDVIVTDLLMPGMNGLELLTELRTRELTTPVIIVSADIQESTKSACAQYGVRAFLNKPFTAAELRDAVEAALAAGTAPARSAVVGTAP